MGGLWEGQARGTKKMTLSVEVGVSFEGKEKETLRSMGSSEGGNLRGGDCIASEKGELLTLKRELKGRSISVQYGLKEKRTILKEFTLGLQEGGPPDQDGLVGERIRPDKMGD